MRLRRLSGVGTRSGAVHALQACDDDVFDGVSSTTGPFVGPAGGVQERRHLVEQTGLTLGRISGAENAVAGGLALAFTLIIWMTDNTSARMPRPLAGTMAR